MICHQDTNYSRHELVAKFQNSLTIYPTSKIEDASLLKQQYSWNSKAHNTSVIDNVIFENSVLVVCCACDDASLLKLSMAIPVWTCDMLGTFKRDH